MKFHTRFDVPVTKGLSCPEKTRTKQSFKDECDINNILKKYQKTGQLPDMIRSNPQFGDFSDVVDYQTGLDIVIKAHTQFMALSADVRDRFANSPEKFLQFCGDSKNLPEMIKMGIAIERKQENNTETKPEVKNEKQNSSSPT